MKNKKEPWKKAYRESMEFNNKWDSKKWCSKMEADYFKVVKSVMKYSLGIKEKEAIRWFFRYACWGNWEKIHETDEEKKITINELAQDLVDEIFYCSDRWSWDRLLRTHWIYQRIKLRTKYLESYNKENEK